MEPQISVIIPVYNVERYLRQCVDSVVGQTYRNLEILIVDDGSTDSSGSICDEYEGKDDRIIVFHTDNHGLSAARNYALDRAHGDYIAFIDSDDWFEETALQTFLATAQNIGADIVACQFYQEYVDKTVEPSGFTAEFVAKGEDVISS